jgi:hypothetical protein
VQVNAADFRRHYELLSDEALLETNAEELVDVARQCLEEEIARRGLSVDAGDSPEEIAAEPATGEEDAAEALVATYTNGDELNLARGLLQMAEIPSRVENPLAVMGGMELRLFVPAAFEEHALEVLAAEISEEELAAQAEAAGDQEEDSEFEDSGNPGV